MKSKKTLKTPNFFFPLPFAAYQCFCTQPNYHRHDHHRVNRLTPVSALTPCYSSPMRLAISLRQIFDRDMARIRHLHLDARGPSSPRPKSSRSGPAFLCSSSSWCYRDAELSLFAMRAQGFLVSALLLLVSPFSQVLFPPPLCGEMRLNLCHVASMLPASPRDIVFLFWLPAALNLFPHHITSHFFL